MTDYDRVFSEAEQQLREGNSDPMTRAVAGTLLRECRPRKWDEALFTGDGRRRWGCCWRRWGVEYQRGRRYVVYLIGGGRLTEFDSLRCARRFCEAIDGLTDWSRPHAELIADAELGLALHRAALKVTGGRPDLRIV